MGAGRLVGEHGADRGTDAHGLPDVGVVAVLGHDFAVALHGLEEDQIAAGILRRVDLGLDREGRVGPAGSHVGRGGRHGLLCGGVSDFGRDRVGCPGLQAPDLHAVGQGCLGLRGYFVVAVGGVGGGGADPDERDGLVGVLHALVAGDLLAVAGERLVGDDFLAAQVGGVKGECHGRGAA